MKSIPIIFSFVGFSIICCTGIFLPLTLFPFIVGLIFTSCSLMCCCTMYNSIFIVLGPNNLTVIQKAICNKKITIYNPGELERIDFIYTKGKKNEAKNNYVLKIVRKNGSSDCILDVGSISILFTIDEIEYFLYTVNTHIQTKMRV